MPPLHLLEDPLRQAKLLSIRGLAIDYPTDSGVVHAVRNIDLDIARGELLGLVGESGSGKTSLGMSVLRLLREPAQVTAGSIRSDGTELLDLPLESMGQIRRDRISLIPQSAMNALNPVMSIGEQIGEALEATAFVNPDGGVMVVAMNRTEQPLPFSLNARSVSHQAALPPRSIATLLLP